MNPRISIPAVFGILLTAFGYLFFLVQKGGKSVSLKFYIIYTLVSVFLFVTISLETYLDSAFDNPLILYVCTQGVFLLLGVLHTFSMRKLMDIEEQESFLPEVIFTLYICFLGAAVLTLFFNILNKPEHSLSPWSGSHASYGLIFASSILVLLIPVFVYHTFIYMISIPAAEYKKWYYPVGKELEIDENLLEDSKLVILELELLRKSSDPKSLASIRGRAPLRMEFGKFFAAWLSEKSEGNEAQKIEFCDEFSQPQPWYFYVKPKWYSSPRYIDFELTVAENELRENDIIIAERVID